MPSKNVKFGKYRSRRKTPNKSAKRGGGLVGDVGSALDTVGSFVKKSGKDVANVASGAVPLLGKAVSYVGSTIHDDAGIGKAMQDVGNFTANTGSRIMNELGKASPAIGDATSWVGKQMKRADPEYGGGLFHSLKFQHGKHAARVVSKLDDHEYGAMQSAARYISGHDHLPGSHPILHHRHSRTVPVKHFHKILSSTRSQLAESLHKAKHHMLHSAVTSSLHSAHIGGGVELETRRYVGGGLDWDKIGSKIGDAAVFAGSVGLAATPVVSFLNPVAGAALGAVSGATAGVGAAVNVAYGKKVL